MKKSLNRTFIESILTSLLLLVIGVLLLIFPSKTLAIISYILGGVIALAGIAGLFRYFLGNDDSKYTKYGLAYGIVLLIVACFFFFKQDDIAKIMPFALGVYMIIKSALKLEYTVKLKKNKNSNWKVTLLLLVVSLLIGLLLIFNPFKGAVVITQIIGAIVVFYAIIDLVETYLVKCNLKDVKDDIKNVIEEIPVVVSEKVEQVVEKAKDIVEDVKEEIEEVKEEIKEKQEAKPKKSATKKTTSTTKKAPTKKSTSTKTAAKKVAEEKPLAKTTTKKTPAKKTTTNTTAKKTTTTKKTTKKEEPTA